jgi:hypothetical protein
LNKGAEIRWAKSTHGRDGKCIQGISGKCERKRPLGRTMLHAHEKVILKLHIKEVAYGFIQITPRYNFGFLLT